MIVCEVRDALLHAFVSKHVSELAVWTKDLVVLCDTLRNPGRGDLEEVGKRLDILSLSTFESFA